MTFKGNCLARKIFQQIDQEVRNILNRGYAEAKEILEQHRNQLDIVAAELLKCETLDAQTFNRLIGRQEPNGETHAVEAAPETLAKI